MPFPIILILGNLIGQALNAIYLTYLIIKNQGSILKEIALPSFKKVGKEHRKFPLYDIPNSLSYSIATQGMNLIFARFFGDVVLGLYSQVQRILITPFSFMSLAFTQVFFEKMSDVFNNNRTEFNKYLKKAQNRLIIYLFLPFFLFVVLSKFIVPFVFGKEWTLMYQYIFVLSPMIFFNLTTSPYTYIFKIINKQEIALVLNIARMVLLIAVVVAGNAFSGDPLLVFTLFSLSSILLTSVSIVICLKFLNSRMSLIFRSQLITLVVLNLILFYLVRYNIF
jgi:O-antigen/teichoic acid export membrane protein